MAEVFAIVSAAAGLLDVTVRLVNYVKILKRGSATILEDLEALEQEVSMFEQVCTAINVALNSRVSKSQKLGPGQKDHDYSGEALGPMWAGVARMMKQCRITVEKIYATLTDICEEPTFSKHVATLAKVHRKRSKEEDLRRCRSDLVMYHGSIQLILTIITREEALDSRDSTSKSLDHLTHQLDLLQSQISNFNASLGSTDEIGYPKAALSAIREFQTTIADSAGLVSAPTGNKFFKIPQSVSSIFTGRETLLRDLQTSFLQVPGPSMSRSQRRFVVYGLGGSGKTQFCCKFAEENRERFWGVFSVDGSSVESLNKTFGDIAKFAGRDPNVSAALDWLSTVEQRWLLLIDNADDPDLPIESYFPSGADGNILITTRNRAFRVLGNLGYYDFSGLDLDEASSLLLKASSLPKPWDSSWEALATQITEALGYLALAIVQAGAAIRERLCSLQDYLGWYDRSWQKLRKDYTGPITRNDKAVLTTFELCYERLEQRQHRAEVADAIELLNVFGFLYRFNISPAILTKALRNAIIELEKETEDTKEPTSNLSRNQPGFGGRLQIHLKSILMLIAGAKTTGPLPSVLRGNQQIDGLQSAEDRIWRALSELEKISLIHYNERNQTYTMHPVIHDWARNRPRMKLSHQALWADIAGNVLSASILLPPLGVGADDQLHHATLLPHIEHVQKWRADIRAQLNLKFSRSWLSWLIKQSSPDTATPNPARIRMFAKFSLVYLQCGRPQQAEVLLKEVLVSLRLFLPPESPQVRAAQAGLAQAYWHQGKMSQALDLQQQVVSVCEKNFGRESSETLEALKSLGLTLWQQGQYSAARKLQAEVVRGFSNLFGDKDIRTLEAKNDLGNTVMKFFRPTDIQEAFGLLSEACEGLKEALGAEHIRVTFPKENLARVSCLIGDKDLLDQALILMEEVITTRKAAMGKEAAWTLVAIGNMCAVLGARGHVQKAELLALDVLPIAERNFGTDHIGVLFGRQILATMLIQQKRYDEAEKMLLDVMDRQRSMSSRTDDFHPDRIVSMIELARCYQLQGKLDESIEICCEVLGGLRKASNNEHPFIEILDQAQARMVELKKSSLEGANSGTAVDIRFPEYLFKIYN